MRRACEYNDNSLAVINITRLGATAAERGKKIHPISRPRDKLFRSYLCATSACVRVVVNCSESAVSYRSLDIHSRQIYSVKLCKLFKLSTRLFYSYRVYDNTAWRGCYVITRARVYIQL